jgi:hypothetical protein
MSAFSRVRADGANLSGRKEPVICSSCHKTRHVQVPANGYKTGLCRNCFLTKVRPFKPRQEDEVLASGAIIHWSERKGRNVPVTCGGPCRTKRRVFIPGGKARQAWDGRCKMCPRPVPAKAIVDDEVLSSGSIYHWSEREGSKVPVTCGVCASKRIVKARSLVDRQKPRAGYHLKCAIQQLPPQTKTKLKDEVLPSGAVIRWSERRNIGQRVEVPVVCICGAVNVYNRQSLKPGVSGRCSNHTIAEIASMLFCKAQAEAVTAKRLPGRKPGIYGFDHDVFPGEVNKYILELWGQHGSFRAISREAVASRFQAQGEMINGKNVVMRLKACGITEQWPSYCESVLRATGEI